MFSLSDVTDDTMEAMVKASRRPSSRDGFVLKVGFLVRHVESHLLRIVDIIQEDYEDGYMVITEAVNKSGAEIRKLIGEDSEDDSDEVVCSSGHLMANEFCEQNKC